jgi:hypothetical protein
MDACGNASHPGMVTRFWGMVFGHWFFLGVWSLLVICYEALAGQIGDLFYDPISRWPRLVHFFFYW